MSLKLPRLQIILDLVFLILVTAIATYFRFYNLSHNPGLYNDEGTLLNIAINLFHGRMIMAVSGKNANIPMAIIFELPLF